MIGNNSESSLLSIIQPKLAEKRFRNVSMITAWNAQKDRVNKLGTIRFAEKKGGDVRKN